jgi:hypothetical protein
MPELLIVGSGDSIVFVIISTPQGLSMIKNDIFQ